MSSVPPQTTAASQQQAQVPQQGHPMMQPVHPMHPGQPMQPGYPQYPAGYAYPPQMMYHAPAPVKKEEELSFCAQFGIRLGITLAVLFIVALIRIFILGF